MHLLVPHVTLFLAVSMPHPCSLQMVFLDNLSLAQSILECGTSLSSHRPDWLYRVDTMDLHI